MAATPLIESTRQAVVRLTNARLLQEHWARDKIGRFAKHDHLGNDTGFGTPGGGAGTKATTSEIAGVRRAALAKARAAPAPTAQDVADFQTSLKKHGGDYAAVERDQRGSAASRRARKTKLISEFGNGHDFAIDVYCGQKLSFDQIEQDRIFPGSKGGKYRYNNIVPCCSSCNKARGNKDFQTFFRNSGK